MAPATTDSDFSCSQRKPAKPLNKSAITDLLEISRRAFFAKSSASRPAPIVQDAFFSAELFEALLCRERKRCERSGQCLVLMLVRAIDPRDADCQPLLRWAAAVVARNIRDTDLTGWYQQGIAFATLFTELGAAPELAAKSIERKMVSALSASPHDLSRLHIAVYTFPEEFDGQNNSRGFGISFYPDVARSARERRVPLVVKRVIDILGSLSALAFLSPVLLLIAIAIKCTSHGPVLFAQQRIGQFGFPFRFLKFRSMRVSNDSGIHEQFVKSFINGKNAGAVAPGSKRVFKLTQDPRVTAVGRFLRRTSLDELPQFWNVLRGEMSLVGPRPPIRYELEAYQLWHRCRLLEAKPGITGLWQVRGRSRTTFDEMVRLDLRYSRTWSLLLDFRILVETPPAVFSGDGAY